MNLIVRMFLAVVLLILSSDIIYSTINYRKKIVYDLEKEQWGLNYETTVWFIKQHEGFFDTRYLCPAGRETIGYGHVIKTGERIPKKITEAQADSLLRLDFGQSMKALDKIETLKGTKKLAMAHYIYAVGVGNFNKSSLKKMVEENRPIDNEIVKFCYYRKNGEYQKSDYALKMRKWELDMFNKEKVIAFRK